MSDWLFDFFDNFLKKTCTILKRSHKSFAFGLGDIYILLTKWTQKPLLFLDKCLGKSYRSLQVALRSFFKNLKRFLTLSRKSVSGEL